MPFFQAGHPGTMLSFDLFLLLWRSPCLLLYQESIAGVYGKDLVKLFQEVQDYCIDEKYYCPPLYYDMFVSGDDHPLKVR